jgi:hypothetical protein
MAILNEDEAMTMEDPDSWIEQTVETKEDERVEEKKRLPSLAESLERGSELNCKLFHGDDDGQQTVTTDDGSLWLDQGSVSCLNIKSSASVAAPQFTWKT